MLNIGQTVVGEFAVIKAKLWAFFAANFLNVETNIEVSTVVESRINTIFFKLCYLIEVWFLGNRQPRIHGVANDVDARMTIFEKFYLCGWAIEQHGVLWVNVLYVVQLAEVVVDGFPVAVESYGLVTNKSHVFHVKRSDAVADHAKVFA